MHVTIRLFARLREIAGASELRRGACRTTRPSERPGTRSAASFPVADGLRTVALVRGQRGVRALDDDAAGRRRGRVPAARCRVGSGVGSAVAKVAECDASARGTQTTEEGLVD